MPGNRGPRWGGKSCPPGCTCNRHNQIRTHNADCVCDICNRSEIRALKYVADKPDLQMELFEENTLPTEDYAAQVKASGFVAHNADIATCSACWMPAKIGKANTVGSAILARAHVQKCKRGNASE